MVHVKKSPVTVHKRHYVIHNFRHVPQPRPIRWLLHAQLSSMLPQKSLRSDPLQTSRRPHNSPHSPFSAFLLISPRFLIRPSHIAPRQPPNPKRRQRRPSTFHIIPQKLFTIQHMAHRPRVKGSKPLTPSNAALMSAIDRRLCPCVIVMQMLTGAKPSRVCVQRFTMNKSPTPCCKPIQSITHRTRCSDRKH
jgi:hypothetical protein